MLIKLEILSTLKKKTPDGNQTQSSSLGVPQKPVARQWWSNPLVELNAQRVINGSTYYNANQKRTMENIFFSFRRTTIQAVN